MRKRKRFYTIFELKLLGITAEKYLETIQKDLNDVTTHEARKIIFAGALIEEIDPIKLNQRRGSI